MKILKQYKDMPIQVRASLWYMVCNILQKGISFLVIPVYTRILTIAEYGQYSVFQSWCNMLIIFATLNLYCGVFTKVMIDYKDDRDRYTSCMQGLGTIVTIFWVMIYGINSNFWNGILEMDTVTVIAMFAYFISYPAFSFWSVRQRIEYKYKKMVIATLLVSVLTPIISIFLLFNTNLQEKAVIYGFLIVQCSVGFIFYIKQFLTGKVFYIKEYWIQALTFNIPLIPHYLSLIVLGQADRIMIQHFCGSGKAGIYNLAYQVSMMMNIFITAINNSLTPWIYEKLKNKNYLIVKEVSNNLCTIVAAMTVGVILIVPEIVKILGTKEYLAAIWIIPAVAISTYFTFCYGLFGDIEFYYGATGFVMVASVTGAVLNIALNVIFIPIFDFTVAGYTLFCYLVFMIIHFIFMRKICREKIEGNLVYDIKFIFLSCVALCICGVICIFLYNNTIVRYFVVLSLSVLAWLNKNKIVEMILTIREIR